ncbi:MAG: hypothetical protein JXA57_06615, partial [Armatimonadetes bacterium]|nr:hypothetical protein [Armatimonadota bacterium]
RGYDVWMIDCGWKGPRHERLRRIWRAMDKYWGELANVRFFVNPGAVWSNATSLDMMWVEAVRHRKNDNYIIFTELDVLPSFNGFLREFGDWEMRPILAPEYAWGVGGHPKRQLYPHASVWYMLFDPGRMRPGQPNFSPGGPFNDPGYNLEASLFRVSFAYPEHCGVHSSCGTHLYWQRHLHDDKHLVVGEEQMRLGEMQEKHDLAVEKWLENRPQAYWDIYEQEARGESDAAKTRSDCEGAQEGQSRLE